MGDTSLLHTALLIALITAFGLAAAGRAPAAQPGQPPAALTAGWVAVPDCFQPFCCASICRR
jgi:hypothetical protein